MAYAITLRFDYKCRRCSVIFEDPGLPIMEAYGLPEVEMILRDSLNKNPVAKKRVGVTQTHLCSEKTIGIGDLCGYRMTGTSVVQEPAKSVSLKLVDSEPTEVR